MRRDPTEPEKRLWSKLRNRQLDGIKFRRQVWLVGFIADFYAADLRLVIEVDGDGHAAREAADEQRSQILQREGFRTIRFANVDVMRNIEGVLEAILMTARADPSPSRSAAPSGPLPLPQGERNI
nr:endonuclease domain-containing protein [Sphingobium sp. Z007]